MSLKYGERPVIRFFLVAMACIGCLSNSFAQTRGPTPHSSQQQAMRFFTGWSGGNHAGAEWIAGEGTITEKTPSDFLRFLDENRSLEGISSTIYLDSPGGNLRAGLELGLLFRERRFNTAVGRTTPLEQDSGNPAPTKTQTIKSGLCASACAYAFLGGNNRSASTGEVGFHQFYTESTLKNALTPSFNAMDISQTQATVGVIALYLKELSIDPEVLFLASTQEPNQIAFPTIAEMRRLRIINTIDQPQAEPWRIEPVGAGAVVVTRIEVDAFTEKRIALHCRRSAPDIIVLRGAWTYPNPERLGVGQPGAGRRLTDELRKAIFDSSLIIGNQTVRTHPGVSGLIDARVDDDGTHRIAFGISLAEYRRGLAEGFLVDLSLPGYLGYGRSFVPPITGLSERMNIALRSCV